MQNRLPQLHRGLDETEMEALTICAPKLRSVVEPMKNIVDKTEYKSLQLMKPLEHLTDLTLEIIDSNSQDLD